MDEPQIQGYAISDPVTGEVFIVHAERPPTAEDIAVYHELVEAARKRMAAEDPDGTLGERQREVIARIRRKAGLGESDRAADTEERG